MFIMSCKSSLWHIKVLLCLGALPSHIAFSPTSLTTSRHVNDSISNLSPIHVSTYKKRGRIRRISNTNLYDTPQQQTEEPFFMQDVDSTNMNMNAQQDVMNGSSNSGGMDAYAQQTCYF